MMARLPTAILAFLLLAPSRAPCAAPDDDAALVARIEALEHTDRAAALDLARRLVGIREAAAGPLDTGLADALAQVARLLPYDRANLDEAVQVLSRALAIREEALGEDHPAVADALEGLAARHYEAGDLEAATDAIQRCIALRERTTGATSALGQAYSLLGSTLHITGNHAEARTAILRSLDIAIEVHGAEHPHIADILGSLAALTKELGDFDEAKALGERALAIKEAHLDPADPSLGVLLSNMASLYQARGEFPAARGAAERSLAILEVARGPNHPHVALAHTNLGSILDNDGDIAGARDHFLKALAIHERASGPKHTETATVLNNLGTASHRLDDLDAARAYLERALAIREEVLGPTHPWVATTLNNLARLISDLGDHESAQSIYRTSLSIRVAAYGPDHPAVAVAVNNLAGSLKAVGDYAGARPLFERSLAMREAALGPDHPGVATALRNLADLLAVQGDHDAALPLYTRSLAIVTARYGPESLEVANALVRQARQLRATGDAGDAQALVERALAIRTTALGEDHPLVAASLRALTGVLVDQGALVEARATAERAVAIREAALGPDHETLALDLDTLAWVLEQAGEPDRARTLLQRSVAITEAARGDAHPRLVETWMLLGSTHEAEGAWSRALAAYGRALAVQEGRMALLDTLSEREALAYVAKGRRALDAWLATVERVPDRDARATEAWHHVLRWKGAVARRLRARRPDREDPATRALWSDLAITRRALSELAFTDMPMSRTERMERREELSRRKEALEREIADQSATYRARLAVGDPDPAEICAALPPDTALVDILATGSGDAPTHAAFVISRSACRPRHLTLDVGAELAEAVVAWREVLADPEAMPARTLRRGARVSELLWAPLAAAVGDASTVLIVPDGGLNAVPFAALPVDGRFLIERHTVAYLDHAADVHRFGSPPPKRAPSETSALLVGDVDFGDAPADTPGATSPSRRAPCLDRSFPPLPGARDEIARLAARWDRHRRRAPARTLTGPDATESAVAGAIGGQELVHVATHGFFTSDRCRSALSGRGGSRPGSDVEGFDPMLLSGLVLAGVNRPSTDGEGDGVLTAEEVSSLPLEGTRLVVLSACETGLGETRSGEGVLGLRRAFAVNGARSLVMSLWSVDDSATAVLMDGFYEGILGRRALGPAEALRRAQLAMLRRQRAQGEARPGTWASFVVSGDWR